MNKLSTAEIKHTELEILKYIHSLCEKHKLRYYLAGGTLLGAVRHQGFIPWDDDIDILMPRSDFEKLSNIINNDVSKYTCFSPIKNDGYYYNFGKIVDSDTMAIEKGVIPIKDLGVWVDVFILEGFPSDFRLQKKLYSRINKLRKRINSYSKRWPALRKNIFIYFLHLFWCIRNKFIPLNKIQKKYEKLVIKNSFESSQFVFPTGGAYGMEVYSKELFNEVKLYNFEGSYFYSIKDYDSYLKRLYKTYMDLPPIEKRVTPHGFDAFKIYNN